MQLFWLTHTLNQENFNESMLHRPPSHLAEKTVLLPCKLRKPELSLQGQRKSLPSSGSDHLGDDLNVTRVTRVRCPSSCFIKTLCLESTLHIRLSRPIVPCIKNRWTAGILSMLQLIRSNHGLVGSWRCDLVPENLGFLMRGQGKLGESDISHSTCHLSIQIFLA